MLNAYYSVVAFIAILVHLIINYDIIKASVHFNTNKWNKGQKAYRRLLVGVFFYYITDAMWGVIASTHYTSLLYVDTILYCAAIALTIILWCQYVITYLDVKNFFGKFLQVVGVIFCVAAIVLLSANHFFHFFFWIESDGSYHTDIVRYISLGGQILLFFLTSVQTIVVSLKSKGFRRRRHFAISLFGIVMIVAVIMQARYALLPFYTMGLLIGNCILHIFVQEDEKEEFRYLLEENNQVIASAGYGIWKFTFGEDGDVNGLIGNEKWHEIFGVPGIFMTPKERLDFYTNRLPKESQKEIANDYAEMKVGAVKTRVFEWNHPSKGVVYLSVGGTKLVEQDGSVSISGFIGDVSEEKRAQKELNRSLEEAKLLAEEASLAKSKFLFNMSHDIRTPMNAIIGFTDLLQKHPDNKEKNLDYIKKIQDSSHFLLSLINNVLEMARIESGKASLDISVNNTDEFVDGFKSVFEETMKMKNIDFSVNVNVVHQYLYSDSLKIREIYLNLLSNAFKYTMPGGKVTMEISEEPSEKEGYCVYVGKVIDSGIGMSKDYLPNIFDEFSREKTYTDNKIKGTGLGMAIVKKYIDLMGGTISVESEVGKGTTFTTRMTFRYAEESFKERTISKSVDASVFEGKRILLAEDNDVNAEIATEILKDLGFLIERAEDGVVCVSMMEQKPAEYYDLVLMDIQMPNVDGYGAASAIRKMKNPLKAQIPIFALTANAFEEDKRAAFDAGMNGHLSKPIRGQELFETLASVLKS